MSEPDEAYARWVAETDQERDLAYRIDELFHTYGASVEEAEAQALAERETGTLPHYPYPEEEE